jgi:hypothetical protein
MIHAVSIDFNNIRPQFNSPKNMIEHIRHIGIVVSDLKVLTGELFLRFYKSIYSYADHLFFLRWSRKLMLIGEGRKPFVADGS